MQSSCNIYHRHEFYAVFRCDLDYETGCTGLRTVTPNIETSMKFWVTAITIVYVFETEINPIRVV